MSDKYDAHYYNCQRLHTILDEHIWGKSINRHDAEFVSAVIKRLQDLSNEAFTFTHACEVQNQEKKSYQI